MFLLPLLALAALFLLTRNSDPMKTLEDLTTLGKNAVGYVRGKAISLTLVDIGGGFALEARAAEAFNAMRDAAAAAGVSLKVNSAFRNNLEQEALYRQFTTGQRSTVVAPPGYSNHQSGIALDLETGGGGNAAFAWLNNNAARFGFVRTVSSEPWHWEHTA